MCALPWCLRRIVSTVEPACHVLNAGKSYSKARYAHTLATIYMLFDGHVALLRIYIFSSNCSLAFAISGLNRYAHRQSPGIGHNNGKWRFQAKISYTSELYILCWRMKGPVCEQSTKIVIQNPLTPAKNVHYIKTSKTAIRQTQQLHAGALKPPPKQLHFESSNKHCFAFYL